MPIRKCGAIWQPHQQDSHCIFKFVSLIGISSTQAAASPTERSMAKNRVCEPHIMDVTP
jgi:hypothetical protein